MDISKFQNTEVLKNGVCMCLEMWFDWFCTLTPKLCYSSEDKDKLKNSTIYVEKP